MESNISSDNNNPQKQKPVPESLYTCTNCHYIPKLYFENNKVTIQCKCCRDCFKIFSIEEFLQKTKEPILGKCIRHPNNKGAGFCKECNSSYCEECLADHKTYPILKEHVIYSNLMQIPNMCQNEKCENKATHYCRECMKYLCEKCIKSGHKAHLNKNLDSKLNQSIFKKCKDNLKEAKSLNEKMKKFKEKLLNKINDSYNKYEKTFKAYCDFMDYVCGVFESVGKDTLDFNVVNNLEATIPNLDGRKKIDCNNINEVSIKAFFDTCDYVNRVKDLCVFENGNKY